MRSTIIFILLLLSSGYAWAGMYVVDVSVANVRSGASGDYKVVAKLMRNQQVESIGQNGDWLNIILPGGNHGWIYKSLLRTDRALSLSRPDKYKKVENEARHALVIGNSDYRVSPLRNPVNDARDISAALKRVGFQVEHKENINRREMAKAVRKFGKQLREGGVGLFYYAGHGMQVDGSNYLIPVDADIQHEDEVSYESVDVGSILDKMEFAGNRLNMVILDACRDNPFNRSFRSSTKGLANIDAPSGTLLAYATAPGRTAADGRGSNGLYTQHLLAQLEKPGVPVEQLFKRVRAGVMKSTDEQQVPWESSSLVGDFYFVAEEQPVTRARPNRVAEYTPRERKRREPVIDEYEDSYSEESSYASYSQRESRAEPEEESYYINLGLGISSLTHLISAEWQYKNISLAVGWPSGSVFSAKYYFSGMGDSFYLGLGSWVEEDEYYKDTEISYVIGYRWASGGGFNFSLGAGTTMSESKSTYSYSDYYEEDSSLALDLQIGYRF